MSNRHPDRRPRRFILSTLAVLLLSGTLALLAPPAMACACGGVVAEPGTETSVSREVALITGDGVTETVHLQLSMDSTAEDLGLLVPTPTPATVTLGDREVFSDLNYAARPRPVEDFHLFGPPVLFSSSQESRSGSTGGAAPGDSVQTLSTVNLGPLEATTLRADDAGALQSWLTAHRYQLRDGLATQIQPYIDEGWTFVAVRLTQEGKALRGVLPPVVMTFASADLVYPMRMSRAASGAETVRTYVLGQHRVQRTDRTATAGAPQVIFAGTVAAGSVRSPMLQPLLEVAPYLTVVDQYFATPSTQIVSDFTFNTAPNDEGFQQTYTVDTYGIPIDIAVIGLLVILAIVIVVWRAVVRRRRVVAVSVGPH